MLKNLLNSMRCKELIEANSILFLDHKVVNFSFLIICMPYIPTYILSKRLRDFPWSVTLKHELFIHPPFIFLTRTTMFVSDFHCLILSGKQHEPSWLRLSIFFQLLGYYTPKKNCRNYNTATENKIKFIKVYKLIITV